jgi:hypothetical protein
MPGILSRRDLQIARRATEPYWCRKVSAGQRAVTVGLAGPVARACTWSSYWTVAFSPVGGLGLPVP